MKARRLATATAFSALVTLLPVLLLSSPSQAEPQRLKVGRSVSGPWSEHLATALFHGVGPLVPRDAVTRTFSVRNDSRQAARASLTVLDRSASDELGRHLAVTARLGEVTADADPATGCTAHVVGPSIPAGGVQEVGVTLAFDDVTGQVAMANEADLDLVVSLTQAGPAGRVDVCGAEQGTDPTGCADGAQSLVAVLGSTGCPDVKGAQAVDGADSLPDTGAPSSAGALGGLGVALFASGVLLLVVRRRETR